MIQNPLIPIIFLSFLDNECISQQEQCDLKVGEDIWFKTVGGIPFTAHGAQISPPPSLFFFFVYFLFLSLFLPCRVRKEV